MKSITNQNIVIASEKGYYVTVGGSVVSPRGVNRKLGISVKKSKREKKGKYYRFTIRVGEKACAIMVHKLQAYQKYGESVFEEGVQVRHLNNNSLDNSADNIAIGTQSENKMDLPREERVRISQKGKQTRIKNESNSN